MLYQFMDKQAIIEFIQNDKTLYECSNRINLLLQNKQVLLEVNTHLAETFTSKYSYVDRGDFNNSFYNSPEWGKMSLFILKRDKYRCQIPQCSNSGPAKYVHHIRDAFTFPSLRLDPDNLITICKEHHDKWYER